MNGINTPVEVRISFGRGNGGVTPMIRINDRVSHSTIADIEISASDLTELLAGGQVIAVTNLPSESQYRKIGRRLEVKKIAPEDFAHLGNRRQMGDREGYGHIPSKEMVEFAVKLNWREAYDEYQWSYHNYGWDLTLRRWVPTTESERIERADPHFMGL